MMATLTRTPSTPASVAGRAAAVIRLHLCLWWQFLISDAMQLMEYRINFAIGIAKQSATLSLAVFSQGLLYQYTDEIAGWSRWELLVLLGVFWIFDAVWDSLMDGLSQVTYDVRRGVMDFVLLRPVSAQFVLSFRRVSLLDASQVILGVALIAYAGRELGLAWNPWGIVLAFLFAICGFVTIYALRFMLVTCVFWLTSVRTLYDLLGPVFAVGQYPVTFFKGWVRFFLSFVVPVAFATTFPAQALLGVADARLLPVGIAMSALTLYASHRFWLVAVRRYASAEG